MGPTALISQQKMDLQAPTEVKTETIGHRAGCKIEAKGDFNINKNYTSSLQFQVMESQQEYSVHQKEINDLLRQNSKILLVTQRWKRDSKIMEIDSVVRQSKKIDDITQRWRRGDQLIYQ